MAEGTLFRSSARIGTFFINETCSCSTGGSAERGVPQAPSDVTGTRHTFIACICGLLTGKDRRSFFAPRTWPLLRILRAPANQHGPFQVIQRRLEIGAESFAHGRLNQLHRGGTYAVSGSCPPIGLNRRRRGVIVQKQGPRHRSRMPKRGDKT